MHAYERLVLFAPAPTALVCEFPLGHLSQQLGYLDEVGLVDRQLIGAFSDFCTYPDSPRWKILLRHWTPPFRPLTD